MTSQKSIRDALLRANKEWARVAVECARCFRGRRPERFVVDAIGTTSRFCDACRAILGAKWGKARASADARNEAASKRKKAAPPAPVSEVVAKSVNPYTVARNERDAIARERQARVVVNPAPAVKPKPAVTTRMPREDLALFARPIRICDLPHRWCRPGKYEWPVLVAQAEADGLLYSQGKATTWELTDAGRAFVAQWGAR